MSVVASPKPQEIIEKEAVKALAGLGYLVIAAGGGGIPVLKQGSNLKGASAVIEKDLVSGLLADLTDADMLNLSADLSTLEALLQKDGLTGDQLKAEQSKEEGTLHE